MSSVPVVHVAVTAGISADSCHFDPLEPHTTVRQALTWWGGAATCERLAAALDLSPLLDRPVAGLDRLAYQYALLLLNALVRERWIILWHPLGGLSETAQAAWWQALLHLQAHTSQSALLIQPNLPAVSAPVQLIWQRDQANAWQPFAPAPHATPSIRLALTLTGPRSAADLRQNLPATAATLAPDDDGSPTVRCLCPDQSALYDLLYLAGDQVVQMRNRPGNAALLTDLTPLPTSEHPFPVCTLRPPARPWRTRLREQLWQEARRIWHLASPSSPWHRILLVPPLLILMVLQLAVRSESADLLPLAGRILLLTGAIPLFFAPDRAAEWAAARHPRPQLAERPPLLHQAGQAGIPPLFWLAALWISQVTLAAVAAVPLFWMTAPLWTGLSSAWPVLIAHWLVLLTLAVGLAVPTGMFLPRFWRTPLALALIAVPPLAWPLHPDTESLLWLSAAALVAHAVAWRLMSGVTPEVQPLQRS